MRRSSCVALIAMLVCGGAGPRPLAAATDPARKLEDAAAAYRELLASPDRSVPEALLHSRSAAASP